MYKNLKSALMVSAICMLPFAAQAGEHHAYHDKQEQGFFHSLKETLTPDDNRMDASVRTMNVAETRNLQRSLAARGFYKGQIDGVWGPQTAEAVRSYQTSVDRSPNGILTTTDLENLGVRVSYNDADTASHVAPAAGGDYTYTHKRTVSTKRYIEKVDIRKHGNGPHARGWQAFQE